MRTGNIGPMLDSNTDLAGNCYRRAVILTGGLGRRLRSVIGDQPKGLALVKGRPILSYLLANLGAQGVLDVILAVDYQADRVIDTIGTRAGDVRIRYSVEDEPRGTGGALRQAALPVGDESMFVLNGDTYVELDLQHFGRMCDRAGAPIGMALTPVADGSRYHAAQCDGKWVRSLSPGHSGPGYINSGVYWMSPAALRALPDRAAFSLENDFLTARAGGNGVLGYLSTSNFIDIGTPEDYRRAQHDDRFR